MAKKISYDPDTIASLVTACSNAKNDLDKAAESLNLVQSHADWTCKEKDEIDDMVRAMKKLVQTTQQNQDGFFSAIRRIAEIYTGKENSISSWFSGVDSLIGKILSIKAVTVGVTGGKVASVFAKKIPDILGEVKNYVSPVANQMKEFVEKMHMGLYTGWNDSGITGAVSHMKDVAKELFEDVNIHTQNVPGTPVEVGKGDQPWIDVPVVDASERSRYEQRWEYYTSIIHKNVRLIVPSYDQFPVSGISSERDNLRAYTKYLQEMAAKYDPSVTSDVMPGPEKHVNSGVSAGIGIKAINFQDLLSSIKN